MREDEDYGFLEIPFGMKREIQTSPRYFWDNSKRGNDAYVILQWSKSGTGHFTYEGKTHAVGPGEAFIAIVPEDSQYFYSPRSKDPWEVSWINFYSEFAIELWKGIRKKFGPVIPIPPDSPAALELRNLIEKASKRQWKDRIVASAAAYQFYLTLWNQLFTPKRAHKQGIEEAAAYLRLHYREHLRVKEVAGYVGMSREHFTRLFHQRFRKSPAMFLREERLKAAARLLETTKLPINEVAFRTGFYSHAQFAQQFRRRYRKTPHRYREVKT